MSVLGTFETCRLTEGMSACWRRPENHRQTAERRFLTYQRHGTTLTSFYISSLAATFEGEFPDAACSYAGKGVARYSR
jgi:hypothetical protein